MYQKEVGAKYLGDGKTKFTVWAPGKKSVTVKLSENNQQVKMQVDEWGYWSAVAEAAPGVLYLYVLDGSLERPDPASRYQPSTVHTASAVVADDYQWQDQDWENIPLYKYLMYELHTGTFSPEGTFEGISKKVAHLKELGINAVELMPVAQFPGSRNWGYDGVYPFAVQNSYGGPDGLKQLVDLLHKEGIAVIMDIVYNHMGPEGSYLNDFGPYFTDKYNTPWGKAINFDDARNDGVRNFFIQNALMWFRDYHIDALRLDAVHAIMDASAYPFLQQLKDEVNELSKEINKPLYIIAESDLNDIKVISPNKKGGWGHDAQWLDDFHHSIHSLVTKEKEGYYEDFGDLKHLEKAYNKAFIYSGEFSKHRQKYFGSNAADLSPYKFVVFIQNHDQTGNRMKGERLTSLTSFECLKLAAVSYILSPYLPMIFMGEEFGEDHPFLYFISHTDKDLVKAVQEGRKKEFAAFGWNEEPADPQSEHTFNQSKLQWDFKEHEQKRVLFEFYKTLINIRKTHGVFQQQLINRHAELSENLLFLKVWDGEHDELYVLMNFSKNDTKIPNWLAQQKLILNSADKEWLGNGDTDTIAAESAMVFDKK